MVYVFSLRVFYSGITVKFRSLIDGSFMWVFWGKGLVTVGSAFDSVVLLVSIDL